MTDYVQEQEMEIEALQAILMDDIEEVDRKETGLDTESRCFQITISPKSDDEDEPTDFPVQMYLIFAHTPNYPDEPPLMELKSVRGVKVHDLQELKGILQKEAMENLGMSMIFTLATSAKEWLWKRYSEQHGDGNFEGESNDGQDEIIEPHGELVTVETFLAWRERFEAEQALEKAKLLPDSALVASKEKRFTGRTWFESGAVKGVKPIMEGAEEAEEEEEFEEDFDDGDIDEDDMLEHYLSGKLEGNSFQS
eukprot:c23310_g1_i1 orf=276-1031(+)